MNTFVNQYLVDNSEMQNGKSWNTNGTRLNFWLKTRLKHVKRHRLLRLNQTQTHVLYTSATNLFKRKLLTYIIRPFLPYQKHSKIYFGLYTQHYIKARTFKREKVLTSHWPQQARVHSLYWVSKEGQFLLARKWKLILARNGASFVELLRGPAIVVFTEKELPPRLKTLFRNSLWKSAKDCPSKSNDPLKGSDLKRSTIHWNYLKSLHLSYGN